MWRGGVEEERDRGRGRPRLPTTTTTTRRLTHLQVHVPIGTDQVTLVLQPPLELCPDLFAGEVLEERFRVDGLVEGGQWVEFGGEKGETGSRAHSGHDGEVCGMIRVSCRGELWVSRNDVECWFDSM
jgi:hypothetical protein